MFGCMKLKSSLDLKACLSRSEKFSFYAGLRDSY